MLELDDKYVFHVPLYKYVDNELIRLDIEDILDELIDELNKHGYDSLYIINVKSYYKSRSFDELLITLFISEKTVKKDNREFPDSLFSQWFKQNNNVLQQEAFAYEHNNSMIIEALDEK